MRTRTKTNQQWLTNPANPAPYRVPITNSREEGTARELCKRYPDDKRTIGKDFGLAMNPRKASQRQADDNTRYSIGFDNEINRRMAVKAIVDAP